MSWHQPEVVPVFAVATMQQNNGASLSIPAGNFTFLTNPDYTTLSSMKQDNLPRFPLPQSSESCLTNVYGTNFALNPLHWASASGNLGTIRSILAQGMDINSVDFQKTTALYWAVFKLQVEVVKELISKGADVNSSDLFGFTPLHICASLNSKESKVIAELLLRNGAKVNPLNCDSASPLHLAAGSLISLFFYNCH